MRGVEQVLFRMDHFAAEHNGQNDDDRKMRRQLGRKQQPYHHTDQQTCENVCLYHGNHLRSWEINRTVSPFADHHSDRHPLLCLCLKYPL